MPDVRVTTLDSGLRVLSERVPGVRSVAAGVWVVQGVAHENPEHMGVSHMLEHMVFKGTRHRSAREIALSLESLGGSLDAYTTREYTSYQARVLDRHLPEALDVLADLTVHPLLRETDLGLEREVVLEEIATVEDTPDDLVFDLHAERLWQGHGYGRAILGTRETVGGLTAPELQEVHRARYRAGNLVVAVAGNLDHDAVVALARRCFRDLPEGGEAPDAGAVGPTASGRDHRVRASAQTHLVAGRSTVAWEDPRKYPVVLLSQALGGGMSSRLFQRIREELGLAYAVFTFHAFHRAAGTFGVYVGTRPGTAETAVEAVLEELDRVRSGGLPVEELQGVREQVKGQMTLAMESLTTRLQKLAAAALHDRPVPGLNELLARYDRVTPEAVREEARELLDPETQLVLSLGPAGG